MELKERWKVKNVVNVIIITNCGATVYTSYKENNPKNPFLVYDRMPFETTNRETLRLTL